MISKTDITIIVSVVIVVVFLVLLILSLWLRKRGSLNKNQFIAVVAILLAAFIGIFVAFILLYGVRALQKPKPTNTTTPVIRVFKAKPKAIVTNTPQSFAVLAWRVEKATSVSVYPQGDPKSVVNVTGKDSAIVRPTQTTTYLLSATNSDSGITVVTDTGITISVVDGPIPSIKNFTPVGQSYFPSVEAASKGLPLSWSINEVTDAYIHSSQSINGVSSFPLQNFVTGNTGPQSGSALFTPAFAPGETSQTFLFELNVHNSVSDYWVGSVAYPEFQIAGEQPGPSYVTQFLYDNNGSPGVSYTQATLPTSDSTPVFQRVVATNVSSTNNITVRFDYGCECNGLQNNVTNGLFDYTPNFPLYFNGTNNVSFSGFTLGTTPAQFALYNFDKPQFLSYQFYINGDQMLYASSPFAPPTKPVVINEDCTWFLAQIKTGQAYFVVQMSGAPSLVQLKMAPYACDGCMTASSTCFLTTMQDDNPTCGSGCQTARGGYTLTIPLSNDLITDWTSLCILSPDTGMTFSFCIYASVNVTQISEDLSSNQYLNFFSFTLQKSSS